jgi:hypothetical protein
VTSRRIRTTSAAAALFTAVALAVPATARALVPTASDSGSGTTAAASTTLPTVTPTGAGAAGVVLPTGDRLVVRTGTGAQSGVSVERSDGGSDALASFQAGGDRYVIPQEAEPYIGRSLDLSLFDVTKLASATPTAGAHIPVQLTFAAGVTPAAPAGVTLTSVSGQSAAGYLTPDSGKAFAQALRDAIKADQAAGHPAGTGALFGGLTSMTAPGAGTPVKPFYPLHILQLNTLDNTGAPSSVPIILVNTDNEMVFAGQVFSYQGVAKAAVPAGNYAVISFDWIRDPQANTVRTNIVSQNGISVPATGTVPPVTIDERTATSQVTFPTQKPATEIGGYTQLGLGDAAGHTAGATLLNFGAGDTYITPEAKPASGTLSYIVNWVGASPATAASPYRYNLVAAADHIDADQTHNQPDSSLATIQHSFSTDPHYGTALPGIGSGFVTANGGGLLGTTAPAASFPEYVTGGLTWYSEMSLPIVNDPTNPVFAFGIVDDDPALLHAGQTFARSWAHAPDTPNVGRHNANGSQLFGCQACSSGGNLNLALGILGDSNADTTGLDFSTAGTAQLYWNGQLVSSDVDHFGYNLQNVPATPATLRAVFDYDRSASGITQSTKTHTDITVPYSGKDDPSQTLPSGIYCPSSAAAPGTTPPPPPCSVLPALTLNYQLNALTTTNTSHSPRQNLVLHVGHLSYGDVGSRAHIDSVQVSVSFDNGATWQDVETHGYDGTYNAHWANPAAGSPVELKVTATDCLGGSITQTVTNPYTVG